MRVRLYLCALVVPLLAACGSSSEGSNETVSAATQALETPPSREFKHIFFIMMEKVGSSFWTDLGVGRKLAIIFYRTGRNRS